MRPASPGRSRFEVVSPGIGSRAELDRMTRIAGSRPARRWGRAARRRRSELHSVPSMAVCQAASSSSSKRPGGGPPELTTSRSSPPKAATRRRDGGGRAVGRRQVGRDRERVEPGGRLGQPVARPRDETDAGTLGPQGRRDRTAEAAAAAADERARAGQSEVHGDILGAAQDPGAALAVERRRRLAPPRSMTTSTVRVRCARFDDDVEAVVAGRPGLHRPAAAGRREADDREVVGPRRSADDGQRRHGRHGVEPSEGGGRHGVPDRAVEADQVEEAADRDAGWSATTTEPAPSPGLPATGGRRSGRARRRRVAGCATGRSASRNGTRPGCRPARSPSPAAAHWSRRSGSRRRPARSMGGRWGSAVGGGGGGTTAAGAVGPPHGLTIAMTMAATTTAMIRPTCRSKPETRTADLAQLGHGPAGQSPPR